MVSTPAESPHTLIFADVRIIPKFKRGQPERWRQMRLWYIGLRIGDFRPLSHVIYDTMHDI